MIFPPNSPYVLYGFDPDCYVALPKNILLGNRVVHDINAILRRGYASEISAHDFFHGHLIGEKGEKISLESALATSDIGILYHTREKMGYDDLQGLDYTPDGLRKILEKTERETGIADSEQFFQLLLESLKDPHLQRNIYSNQGKLKIFFPKSVDLTEPIGKRICTVYDTDLGKHYVATVYFKVSQNGNYRLNNGPLIDIFVSTD